MKIAALLPVGGDPQEISTRIDADKRPCFCSLHKDLVRVHIYLAGDEVMHIAEYPYYVVSTLTMWLVPLLCGEYPYYICGEYPYYVVSTLTMWLVPLPCGEYPYYVVSTLIMW